MMDRVSLKELHMSTRKEALSFLKKLWAQEAASCPICGNTLEILHKRAKKSSCDWQCRHCGKVYKTMHLLDELNRRMPV